ncbi:hypothetical protein DYJ26_04500 [Salmonella enterica]|nr:hypothetical protein [Salmonella enterica]ECI2943343.1 hypothetical protein [Salmonella enterica subsp. diarizonae]ECI3369444.1 hypothetical protein [Salmonella enterica subsp. diarizonae]ECI4842250.1 hypothetical protein [Salmonella enterica subsp. diarizonae]
MVINKEVSTVLTVQKLINSSHHDNDKRKDNTNPQHDKHWFTHGSAKKTGRQITPLHKKKTQNKYNHITRIFFHMQLVMVKMIKWIGFITKKVGPVSPQR